MSGMVEKLATEAFETSERVRALMMMNEPVEYEKRKASAVALAVAREAANKAEAALAAALSPPQQGKE